MLEDVDSITEICTIKFSPTEPIIAIGGEKGLVWIWNFDEDEKWLLKDHSTVVESLVFCPDGQNLVSGCSSGNICIWDLSKRKLMQSIDAHDEPIWSVAVDSTGTVIATGSSDQTVRLWSANTQQHLKTFKGHTGVVYAVAFMANGSLISGGQDETIRVWDVDTEACTQILRADRVYERMNIVGATGLTAAQRESLIALGSVEVEPSD